MDDREFSAVVDFPIYVNDRKQGKQPDHRGTVEMTKELVKEMVVCIKRGEVPRLECAVWNNTSKKGLDYMYVKVSMNEWAMNKAKKNEAVASPAEEADDDIF